MKTENEGNKIDLRYIVNGVVVNYYVMPEFIHIGRVQASGEWGYSEHLHNTHEWILVNKGDVHYTCNKQANIAKEGDLYFIQPSQYHSEESHSQKLDFFYIKFNYYNLKGKPYYFVPLDENPDNQIVRKANKQFKILIKEIYKEILCQEPGTKQIVEAKLLELSWMMRRVLDSQAEDSFSHDVSRKVAAVNYAIKFIEKGYSGKITLAQIAQNCIVSADYLSHIFKEITGFSPLQYADQIRVNEAKKLLLNSELKYSEIASLVGMSDEFYFSKKFKKIVGLSPNEYKSSHQDKEQK